MVRSKLRNKYLKSKSEIDKQIYKKQKNYCVKLLRLKNQKYYESLDISKITDNKTFWKIISPLFSNKSCSTNSRITLLENGDILSEEPKVADTFNEFFSNVVKELKIEKDDNLLTDAGAQPGIFWGRGGFLEWGHFDKRFMCDTQKKNPAGKRFWCFFSKMLLKLHFK